MLAAPLRAGMLHGAASTQVYQRRNVMERKSVRRTVYLGERLNAGVEEMLFSREMDFATMVRQLLEQELERWKRTNIQLTPKARPSGGAVGRPAHSPKEKQFKEQVRYIEQIYFELE